MAWGDGKDMDPTAADGKPSETGGICGANTKSGGICANRALENGRCKFHGGRAAKGIKAGHFKHGRYSTALKKLDADISDRVNDPKLVDPRRSIAVQEATLAKLSELAEERDSPAFRETLRKRMGEAMKLMRVDPSEALGELRAIQRMIERGAEETRALAGMREAAESVNKSQIRYWQTAMSAARAISPEEFIQLMFRMADIIEGEVDKDAARRILERTDREVCGGSLGLGK